jgi:hypothetical protein
MDDITQLIIYILIGVIGLLASAFRNKQKRRAQSSRIPGDIITGPMPDVQPDLGPLAEIFGFPDASVLKPAEIGVPKEPSIEDDGYRVEEEGLLLDNPVLETERPAIAIEKVEQAMEKVAYEGMPAFKSTEETLISDSITDSAITDSEGIYESISASEIKGVEEGEGNIENEGINWRKAVIYSEILQRRGN